MRRTLGPALALALLPAALAGCGAQTSSDAASDRSPGGAPSSGSAVHATQVALVSQTAAGGKVDGRPVRLDEQQGVERLTGGLRGALPGKVSAAVRRAHVPSDHVLVGAVVAVGCDVPPGVRVESSGSSLRIVAKPVKSPLQECFAPVTTVAVVSVPSDAV